MPYFLFFSPPFPTSLLQLRVNNCLPLTVTDDVLHVSICTFHEHINYVFDSQSVKEKKIFVI